MLRRTQSPRHDRLCLGEVPRLVRRVVVFELPLDTSLSFSLEPPQSGFVSVSILEL